MRRSRAMRRIQRSDLIDTGANISAPPTLTPLRSVDNVISKRDSFERFMRAPYVSFLLYSVLVLAAAAGLIILSHLLAPRRPTASKLAPYESGMPPLGDAHE